MLEKKDVNSAVLLIDKPQGYTSFDVVAIIRKLCNTKKVGHTGTLDPIATGVLPILIGKATKAQSLLVDSDKEYIAEFKLGISTDTQDISGKILKTENKTVSKQDVENVLESFRGNILQIPPMYSALKKDGKKLCNLARKGIEVSREARPITIYDIKLISFNEKLQEGKILVSCSKGTYVRTLCNDIGEKLSTLAVLKSLRRTKACGFTINECIDIEKAKQLSENGCLEKYFKATESLFKVYPSVTVSKAQSIRFKNGGDLMLSRLNLETKNIKNKQIFKVYSYHNEFLGLGIVSFEKEELLVLKQF